MTERNSIDLTSARRQKSLEYRLAKITEATEDLGPPYASKASIYKSRWLKETSTERNPDIEDAVIWTASATVVGQWVLAVQTPFGHWEGVTAETSKPWDIAFYLDGAAIMAECSLCVYMRGPVTKSVDVDPLELTIADVFIAANINLETGAAVLTESASLAAATDAEPQSDDTTYKLLLYRAVKVGSTYVVTVDYRAMPQLGVRI